MRGLLLSMVYGMFVLYGLQMPFILILGYVWVDIFTPQLVAYNLISRIPVSLILGALVFLHFLLGAKREKIGQQPVVWLIFIFSIWMTMSLLWAEVPAAAYVKWDWAFKSVVFSCFVPFFVQGRLRLEAFLWVILVSGMGHCIPFGTKVLISGGGYGQALGLVAQNHGYGEGSTLSMFAVTLIPIALFLLKHQTIFPKNKLVQLGLLGCVFAALLTSVGTFARTGLICVAVLAVNYFIATKRKAVYLIVLAVMVPVVVGVAGEDWEGRMSTIGDSSEGSAMGRVAAWMWTLEYVASHPLGGSFDVYRINSYVMELANGELLAVTGKAFHSAYFEILGEMGFPGFFLYVMIAFLTWLNLKMAIREGRRAADDWLVDGSKAILLAFYVYLAGSAFIGVGFQSYFYYIAVISVILRGIRKYDEIQR
jgi:probable O-glycosylation ligase (exosortase A-associated)